MTTTGAPASSPREALRLLASLSVEATTAAFAGTRRDSISCSTTLHKSSVASVKIVTTASLLPIAAVWMSSTKTSNKALGFLATKLSKAVR